jgi:hypothetical protein
VSFQLSERRFEIATGELRLSVTISVPSTIAICCAKARSAKQKNGGPMMTRAFRHFVLAILKAASEIEKPFVERHGVFIDPAFPGSFVLLISRLSSIFQYEQFRASSLICSAQDRSSGFLFGLEVSTINHSPSRSIPQRSTQ